MDKAFGGGPAVSVLDLNSDSLLRLKLETEGSAPEAPSNLASSPSFSISIESSYLRDTTPELLRLDGSNFYYADIKFIINLN